MNDIALTNQQFKEALPAQMRSTINQDIIDKINDTLSNPDTYEMFRENIVGYTSVMKQGKFRVSNYIDAVKYVSYKTMGDTNLSAYIKTFPDKHASFIKRGISSKDISSYVSAYNKNKLVSLIYEQSLIPTYILNADKIQAAINNLAVIMADTDVCSRDRVAASIGLLNNIKAPETKKIELDVTHKEDSTISILREQTAKLVAQQKLSIESGEVSAAHVVNVPLIIEGEITDVEPEQQDIRLFS